MMLIGAMLRSEKMGVLLGRLIDATGSLCFLKLLSVLATKDEVGKYLLASSILAFMLTVSYSALDQGMLRNVSDYRQQNVMTSRYSAMLTMYLCTGAIFAFLFLSVIEEFNSVGAIQSLRLPLAIWLTFEAVKNLNNAWASALRKRFQMAGASFLEQAIKILMLWLLFRHASISATSLVVLMSISSAVAASALIFGSSSLLSRFSWVEALVTFKDSIKFSWPMIIWGAFGWFQNMSNRWFLGEFMNLPSVAEYGVLSSIATFPVTALFGLVVMYIVPILYEKETSMVGSSKAFVLRTALLLTPVCVLMVAVAFFSHNLIVSSLADPNYLAHSAFLPVLLGASCLNYLGSILTYAIYAQRKVASLLLANILPGFFGVVFGYYAVQSYGFEGAILAFSLSNVLSCLLFILAFLRH